MANHLNDFEVQNVSEGINGISKMPDIKIENEERCPRYLARVIDGVKVGPSPK